MGHCNWLNNGPQMFLFLFFASLVAQMGKNPSANAGNLGLIPGSRRSPEEGNGYPVQYTCLENSMDRGAWQATVHWVIL